MRAALARVLAEAPLDALQMGALRAAVEADETAAKPDARTSGRQTFAKRLIERYLDHHDALDVEFAARLREAGDHLAAAADKTADAAPAVPPASPEAIAPLAAADREAPTDREAAAGGETEGAAGVSRGVADPPDALRAAVRAVSYTHLDVYKRQRSCTVRRTPSLKCWSRKWPRPAAIPRPGRTRPSVC